MPRKRKRGAKSETQQPQGKKCKVLGKPPAVATLNHPILSLYYAQVRSLRDHLLHCLPLQSRARRRQIQAIPAWVRRCYVGDQAGYRVLQEGRSVHDTEQRDALKDVQTSDAQTLSWLLDSTLIGVPQLEDNDDVPGDQEFVTLSQQSSSAAASNAGFGAVPLSEVGRRPSRLSAFVSDEKMDILDGAISLAPHADSSTLDCRSLPMAAL